MPNDRRIFLKNALLFTAGAVIVPAVIMSLRHGEYRVKYTVSGESDEAIKNYLKMIDSKGVRDNNRRLASEGLIVRKTDFRQVASKRWECLLVFRSEMAFNKFLDSSRPIISDVYEYKRSHNIQINLSHVS